MRRKISAEKISWRSYRYRQKKIAENSTAFLFREQIRHERWRNRNERCFADSDQRVPDEQLCVGTVTAGEKGRPLQNSAPSTMMSFREYRSGERPTNGAATM